MMTANKEVSITKDVANKKLIVVREFDAPVEQVWRAWTESDLLDQWWAPKPWKTKTKSMNFKEGGRWLYAMVGPDGDQQWLRVDYHKIDPYKSYTALDAFCDENGNKNEDFPSMHWRNTFSKNGNGTKVVVEITFSKEEDMKKVLEMGIEEGFLSALGNLDELLLVRK